MTTLRALDAARSITGAERLAALRDAAEAIAESIRKTPVRSAEVIVIDRMLVETRALLPDARLVSPFAVVTRRATSLVAADGTRVLLDPSDAGPTTPYEERLAARHPVLARAFAPLRTRELRWPTADVVLSTTLSLRSIERSRAQLADVRWIAYEREIAAAKHPSPRDAARYARTQPAIEAVNGTIALAPGVIAVPTPGASPGHASVVFSHRGRIHVHTHAAIAVDAWSPYESKIPGLREAVRLRNVEAVVRGDASDPTAALEGMAIERALADRDARAPAFLHVVPALSLTTALIAPRLRSSAPVPFT